MTSMPQLIEPLRPEFQVGRTYNRRADIHGPFGGQRQGGISTPRNARCLFLFTGSAGTQHGYDDGWTDDGVFVYFGEGQHGDMEFVKGNRAIRDHVANGRTIFLFESLTRSGNYRYLGEFVCGSTEFRQAPDSEGNIRQAIAFHLLPVGTIGVDDDPPIAVDLASLRNLAFAAAQSAPQATTRDTRRITRERSAAVARYVLARADGKCESCGEPAPFIRRDGRPYLEPHHTTRLADDGPDDPRTVGATCPNCHREIHFGPNGPEKNSRLQQYIDDFEQQLDQQQ